MCAERMYKKSIESGVGIKVGSADSRLDLLKSDMGFE